MGGMEKNVFPLVLLFSGWVEGEGGDVLWGYNLARRGWWFWLEGGVVGIGGG